MRTRRTMFHAPRSPLPQFEQTPPRRTRGGKFPIGLKQFFGRLPAIQTPQQNCSSSLDHGMRSVIQSIRQPNVGNVFAQPDGMRQIRVGVIFDYELRWPSLATQARIDSLKNPLAAGHRIFRAGVFQEGFLRTGTGVNSFAALSASDRASLVPSIASSKVSL